MNREAARRWVRTNCAFAKIAATESAFRYVQAAAKRNNLVLTDQEMMMATIKVAVCASLASSLLKEAGPADWLKGLFTGQPQAAQPQADPAAVIKERLKLDVNELINAEIQALVGNGQIHTGNRNQWLSFAEAIKNKVMAILAKKNLDLTKETGVSSSGALHEIQKNLLTWAQQQLANLVKNPQSLNNFLMPPSKTPPTQPPGLPQTAEDINWQG